MKLCCVDVTVYWGTDATLRVMAGTSAAQAQSPSQCYLIHPREPQPTPIVVEILRKLADALERGDEGIDLTISGRFIEKGPMPAGPPTRLVVGMTAPVGMVAALPAAVTAGGEELEVTRAAAVGVPGPLVNVNSVTEAELASLPGIGLEIAGRVIADRPFRSVDELLRVRGIGAVKLDAIRTLVTVV